MIVKIQKDGRITLPSELLERMGVKENDAVRIIPQNRHYILLKKNLSPSEEGQGDVRKIFCGNIEGFGIADLFSMLNMTMKTGALSISSGEAVKSIYFRKGEIIFASSNLPEDRLGTILYRTGKMSKTQLEEAEKSLTPGTRFGSLLLRKELIAPKDLWWGVKYQLEEIIFSVFSFDTGDFLFVEGVGPEEDLVRFSLNTQNLLMEGYRRLDEWRLICEKIPSKGLIMSLKEKTPNMELTPTMQKVLTMVDGKADVAEVIRRSQLGEFSSYKILYQLLNAGILHIVGREEKAEPREDEGVLKLRSTIEKYSGLYKKLYSVVRKEIPHFDALEAFNSFFSELSEKLQKLFRGVSLDETGGVPVDQLLNNVKGLKLLESEGFSKIAGLNELFISQLLLEGLNELLNFEFFTVKNILPPDASDKVIKEIRELQQTQ